MLLTPHTLVGIAIATSIRNPTVAVPLALGMHFMGDLVPHWDFYSHTKKEERVVGWRPMAVMFDLVVGVSIGLTSTLYALWVLQNKALAINIFLCGIASVLPDALEAPHIFMKTDPKILMPLINIQKKLQFQAPLPWGIITQILVVAISVIVMRSSF